jgi:hypothetical protein
MGGGSDDEGFASFDDDDGDEDFESSKRRKHEEIKTPRESSGDFIKDFYAEMETISEGEELSKIYWPFNSYYSLYKGR